MSETDAPITGLCALCCCRGIVRALEAEEAAPLFAITPPPPLLPFLYEVVDESGVDALLCGRCYSREFFSRSKPVKAVPPRIKPVNAGGAGAGLTVYRGVGEDAVGLAEMTRPSRFTPARKPP